jgi:hypothetical protein
VFFSARLDEISRRVFGERAAAAAVQGSDRFDSVKHWLRDLCGLECERLQQTQRTVPQLSESIG